MTRSISIGSIRDAAGAVFDRGVRTPLARTGRAGGGRVAGIVSSGNIDLPRFAVLVDARDQTDPER